MKPEPWLWMIAIAMALVLYFIPWLIALKRSHKHITLIFFLNLLTTPTGIGWIACLIWASVGGTKNDEAVASVRQPENVVEERVEPSLRGDEAKKRCPFCGEEILTVAIKCKHCQSDLAEPSRTLTL